MATAKLKGRKPADRRASGTSPERIMLTEKERAALELRKSGATLDDIARELGYCNRGAAHKAIRRALDATLQEPAAELREMEQVRLNTMLVAIWPKVKTGDHVALQDALSIMDRRAKLLGLDAPSKRSVEIVTMDAFSAAMAELEGEIAELEARKRAQAAEV